MVLAPAALLFIALPQAVTVVDEGLKWILALKDQRAAERRIEEVGEAEAPTSTSKIDDDLLYPFSYDGVLTGAVLKKIISGQLGAELQGGAERAALDKQQGALLSCDSCGRICM